MDGGNQMSWKVVAFAVITSVVAYNGFGPGRQTWGYSEVRPKAFIFWWLYHAQRDHGFSDRSEKPLILWLQGGPGGSSSGFGNFEEIGPLDRFLKPRRHTWVNDYNVLFVDSPVGSGFSYVEDHSLLARNSTTVAKDLLVFLKDFYATVGATTGVDWEGGVPLYIASESYGGRIAVEFAYALAQEVHAGTMSCHVAGLFLGNAWLSPMDSIAAWPEYLLGAGYLDDAGRERIARKVSLVQDKLASAQPGMAMDGWQALQQAITQETGGINCYNVLKPNRKETAPVATESDEVLEYGETVWWLTDTGPPVGKSHRLELLMRGPVVHTLGLENKPPWGGQRTAVFEALGDDFLQSSVPAIERLLNETDIELVLYNGHLDLITCLPGTFTWVNRMFRRRNDFRPRRDTFTGDGSDAPIEGYRNSYSPRFTLYTVLRAGHMVPADNPTAMAHILRMHITGSSSGGSDEGRSRIGHANERFT